MAQWWNGKYQGCTFAHIRMLQIIEANAYPADYSIGYGTNQYSHLTSIPTIKFYNCSTSPVILSTNLPSIQSKKGGKKRPGEIKISLLKVNLLKRWVYSLGGPGDGVRRLIRILFPIRAHSPIPLLIPYPTLRNPALAKISREGRYQQNNNSTMFRGRDIDWLDFLNWWGFWRG